MALKIVFALLAHGDPKLVAHVVRTMIKTGHRIVVHYDAKVADPQYEALQAAAGGDLDTVRYARRVRVGWGEWSVVQATLNCIETIEASGWEPDYVYLMSGMDYPIRDSGQLEHFLRRNQGDEFIESVPSESIKWVKSGPQRERYQYRWYFNWRDNPQLTENVFALQRNLGLKRRFLPNMSPHLGSQWWVLTWPTLKAIMTIARQPGIVDFFRTTLIADELFFQTLVRQVVPDNRIIGCPLTLYQFTDYGYPVVYHADHLDYLTRQRFFMARKLSSHDMALRDQLEPYWTGDKRAPAFMDEDVGIRSTEFDDWRLNHREGPPGQPLVGGAGLRWSAGARRTTKAYFVVLGTSTAELHFVHRILAHNAGVLMHGQLFHATEIEFAAHAERFAGYSHADVQARDVSDLDFLADVVRAEPARTTGFLLRWQQGGTIDDALLTRPNVRIVLLTGDPLVSFSENLTGRQPALDATFDPGTFAVMPPAAAANRFRVFLKEFQQHTDTMDKRFTASAGARPKGWMGRFDPARIGPDWLKRLELCLGVKIDITAEAFEAERAAAAADYDLRRQSVMGLLLQGGIDPVVFEVLRQGGGSPSLALALA